MKKLVKIYCLPWWIWMFTPLIAHGQYDFVEFLSKENGMPFTKVTDAATDSKGYLWLGAEQGLYRFDGLNFVHVPLISGKDSIYLRNIYKIEIDKDDRIYCSFLNNGLGVFDPHTFELTHYLGNKKTEGALPSNTIDFLTDADSLLFMILESDGFALFDKAKKRFRHFLPANFVDAKKYPRANDLLTCTRDRNQPSRLWITCSEGLFRFDMDTEKLHFFPGDEATVKFGSARCSYMHPDGRLYIGSWWSGIIVFNTLEMRWEEQYAADKDNQFDLSIVSTIAQRDGTELWVHGRKGLFSLRPGDRQCTLHLPLRDKNAPLESDRFWNLRAEVEKIIPLKDGSFAMIGGGIEGMHIYHPNQQQLRKTKTGTVVHYSAFAKDGSFYLTTNEPFFFENPPGGGKAKKIPIEMVEQDLGIRDCFMDGEERLWLVGEKSLYRYSRGDAAAKSVFLKCLDSLDAHVGWMLSGFLDSRQRLWIGTNWEIIVFEGSDSQNYRVVAFSDTLSGARIPWRQFTDFIETGENRVWFACDRGFGFSDDGGKTFHRYDLDARRDKPFEFADFNSLALDKNGRLWVGSASDGLVYILPGHEHPQTVSVIGGSVGKNQLDQVKAIRSDEKGDLWALSASGLFKIDAANLSVSHFGRGYGLLPAQLLTLGSLPGNRLFLGTLDGYYTFQPAKMETDRRFSLPQVLDYTLYTVPGKSSVQRFPKEIRIGYPYRSFRVNYGMPWFWDASEIKFQYRLKGYHQNWVEAGNERSIFLGEIPHGNYTLELRASNAPGDWSDLILTSLPVHIVPAFWETAWFRLLASTLLIGALFWVYFYRKIQRNRERAMKAEFEAELSRLELSALRAQINPHFIFNALNSLKWSIIKGEQESTLEFVDKFSLLVRKALECSKQEMIPLHDELEIISLLLEIEQARFKHKFDYEIAVDEQVDIHHLQIPPLLLQPFVENAIWHGLLHKNDGRGKLSIRLDALPNGFRCIVEDNGIGRERAREFRNLEVRKNKSFGVQISRERMALLSKHQFRDAHLSFEDLTHADGAPAGTRVTITWQH